jgi:16S rRNA (cytosine967-C5)-methyltransferase
MVVCDVPCSGSGTWRRTPENLSEFNTKQIEEYARLQRKIVGNSLPFLKPGGTLVYITCSVFSAENRVNAEIIAAENGLKLKESGVIGGLKLNADYLYRAVLKKP